jgi:hypothetical protein
MIGVNRKIAFLYFKIGFRSTTTTKDYSTAWQNNHQIVQRQDSHEETPDNTVMYLLPGMFWAHR